MVRFLLLSAILKIFQQSPLITKIDGDAFHPRVFIVHAQCSSHHLIHLLSRRNSRCFFAIKKRKVCLWENICESEMKMQDFFWRVFIKFLLFFIFFYFGDFNGRKFTRFLSRAKINQFLTVFPWSHYMERGEWFSPGENSKNVEKCFMWHKAL